VVPTVTGAAFIAGFNGVCRQCSEPFVEGDTLGRTSGGIVCFECWEEARSDDWIEEYAANVGYAGSDEEDL
jgi:hypothetical protein